MAKEQELQKIHVKKEDIEVIVSVQLHGVDLINRSDIEFLWLFTFLQVNELLIPRHQAEKVLREHRGDVVNALIALTN